MAWAETCSMHEKARFCMCYERGEGSMSELCRRFGVSRKTGYGILARWRSAGPGGLSDRSHAPHHRPQAVSKSVRQAILGLRGLRPTWGPKKLKRRLELDHPEVTWPAASTIGDLLARSGVVARRKRLRHVPPRTAPLAHCQHANDVWSVDFKGWFRTADGSRCDPLTLQDQASRYLIRVATIERMDAEHVWAVLGCGVSRVRATCGGSLRQRTTVRLYGGPAVCPGWRCG